MTVRNDVRAHTTDLHCTFIVFETMSFRSEVHATQADQDEYV